MKLLHYYSELQAMQGEIPAHYGVAWVDLSRAGYYCLPIPLNRIVGSYRAWWLELRRPVENDPIIAAYGRGQSEGFTSGYKQGETAADRRWTIFVRAIKEDIANVRRDVDG